VKIGNTPPKLKISGPVLVTGHTGFKGAWFTELLQSLSLEVAGYSLEPSADALYTKLNHRGKLREEIADVRDLEKLSKFTAAIRPEAVFHFAAQPLVLDSYRDPLNTFSTNVMGTTNLLEASFKCDSVKVIVVVTTDKVYKNDNKGIKFRESDPLMGKDPYSASKVAAEQAVSAWRQIRAISGGPNVISVRAGNVIGGGDVSSNRLLPDLVAAFRNKKCIEIRNPQSTRPWQHVLDPLFGYYLAAQYALTNNDEQAFNFSSESSSLQVGEVVDLACVTWGDQAKNYVSRSSTSNSTLEAEKLDLDATKAQTILNWKSQWTQSQAVIDTINWWKKFEMEKFSPNELCKDEVKRLFLGEGNSN